MQKWIPCGEKFIVGDVIRWIEPIWLELKKKKKGTKKKKVEKLGTRRVTAEVVKVDASGYVSLSVCDCEILSNIHGLKLQPLQEGRCAPKAAKHDREGKRGTPEMEPGGRAGGGSEQIPALKRPISARGAREN